MSWMGGYRGHRGHVRRSQVDREVENMEGDVGMSRLKRNRGDTTDGHVGRSPVDREVENIMEGDVGTSMMKRNGTPQMDM